MNAVPGVVIWRHNVILHNIKSVHCHIIHCKNHFNNKSYFNRGMSFISFVLHVTFFFVFTFFVLHLTFFFVFTFFVLHLTFFFVFTFFVLHLTFFFVFTFFVLHVTFVFVFNYHSRYNHQMTSFLVVMLYIYTPLNKAYVITYRRGELFLRTPLVVTLRLVATPLTVGSNMILMTTNASRKNCERTSFSIERFLKERVQRIITIIMLLKR